MTYLAPKFATYASPSFTSSVDATDGESKAGGCSPVTAGNQQGRCPTSAPGHHATKRSVHWEPVKDTGSRDSGYSDCSTYPRSAKHVEKDHTPPAYPGAETGNDDLAVYDETPRETWSAEAESSSKPRRSGGTPDELSSGPETSKDSAELRDVSRCRCGCGRMDCANKSDCAKSVHWNVEVVTRSAACDSLKTRDSEDGRVKIDTGSRATSLSKNARNTHSTSRQHSCVCQGEACPEDSSDGLSHTACSSSAVNACRKQDLPEGKETSV